MLIVNEVLEENMISILRETIGGQIQRIQEAFISSVMAKRIPTILRSTDMQ